MTLVRTSPGTRAAGVALLAISTLPAMVAGARFLVDLHSLEGLVLAQAAVLMFVALARAWIQYDDTAVIARNLLFEYRFPWSSIAAIEARDRVVIRCRDDRRYRLWAVQRANIAGILGRESVVDRTVGEIREFVESRTSVEPLGRGAPNHRGGLGVTKRLIKPTRLEWVLILCFAPAFFVLGFVLAR